MTFSSDHAFNTAERCRWSIFCRAFVIVAGVTFAMIGQACSVQRDRSQEVGSLEDYLAQSQTEGYPYGYVPYDPFLPGYGLYWYAASIYYSSLDADGNDCKKGKCARGKGEHSVHTGKQALSARPVGGFANGTEINGTSHLDGAFRFGGNGFGGYRMGPWGR